MSLIPGLFPSPLRYPGGKGRIAPYIKALILENGLIGCDYVEPYAGGASVALDLLYEDYIDVAHINDLNRGVHAFWHSALHATEDLCDLVRTVPVTIEEWHQQRAVSIRPDASLLEIGFATFFLNRTNRSGIIKGGVIGGRSQDGRWTLDARFNRDDLVSRIRKVGRHRSRIELTRNDAGKLLAEWSDQPRPSALIYLDPPYYVKGSGLYDNFYNIEDHETIAAIVSNLSHPWIVSYDAVPEILNLYRNWESLRYSLNYSANTRSRGAEVMFFSSSLRPPDGLPDQVRSRDVATMRVRELLPNPDSR